MFIVGFWLKLMLVVLKVRLRLVRMVFVVNRFEMLNVVLCVIVEELMLFFVLMKVMLWFSGLVLGLMKIEVMEESMLGSVIG